MSNQAIFQTCLLAVMLTTAWSLTCTNEQLKVTIKTDPDEYEFDIYEEFMLQGTVAYSVRKFCGTLTSEERSEWSCPAGDTETADVVVSDVTARISMCVQVSDSDPRTVSQAIKESKANMNGALLLTDDLLFVEGYDPTLEPEWDPDFDPWLIVYIVICVLVLMAGVAMIVYSRMHSKPKMDEEKTMLEDDDGEYVVADEKRVNEAYENGTDKPTLTML